MSKRTSKGFTLVELLVVIAIIGLLSTLAVVALNSARQKSRDSKRVADMKQIQTALELYYADNNAYPGDPATATDALGNGTAVKLCNGGWQASGFSCTTTYMGLVPKAPTPNDGTCTAAQNAYDFVKAADMSAAQTAGTSYEINFCLGGVVGDLAAGVHKASPNGLQ